MLSGGRVAAKGTPSDVLTAANVRKVFDLELTGEQLAEYRERTHGWITALQLVLQVAQKTVVSLDNSTPDLRDILRQSEGDIFDYFADFASGGSKSFLDLAASVIRLAFSFQVSIINCATNSFLYFAFCLIEFAFDFISVWNTHV